LKLNELAGETFQFRSGTASADLFYKGSVLAGDSLTPFLDGKVEIRDGDLSYLPRSLEFSDCNATIAFSGQDLFFRNLHVKSGKRVVSMEGRMGKILGLVFKAPEKILLDWKIQSPIIDLDEFHLFLGKRKTRGRKAGGKASRLSKQLEIVLEACNVNMRVEL